MRTRETEELLATILVAEDSPSFRNAVASFLRGRDYEVITAEDGEQALRLLRERDVSLVILDMVMPKLCGRDLVAAIRSDPDLSHIPVVVATASPRPDLEREVRPAVQAWLVKPDVSLAEILECVGQHLALARAEAPTHGGPRPGGLGGVPVPRPARHLLRLDLDLVREEVAQASGTPQSEDDLLRHLGGIGVWRHNDQWWGATDESLRKLPESAVIERRPLE